MASNPNGKAVLRASFHLFRQDPKMVWLPIISTIATLCSIGIFVASGVLVLGRYGIYAGLLVSTFVTTFVTVTCNVALVFAATDRIEGRTPSVRGSLVQAWNRRDLVLRWTVVSVTVGAAIRAFEQRLGIFGRIFGFLGAFAWIVATYLVVPVLAFEDLGPFAAVRQSSHTIKEKFGTVGRSGLRFGVLFAVPLYGALIVMILGGAMVPSAPLLGVPIVVIGFAGLVAVGLYAGAASIYMRTVLYRYATGRSVPEMNVDLAGVLSSPEGTARRGLLGR